MSAAFLSGRGENPRLAWAGRAGALREEAKQGRGVHGGWAPGAFSRRARLPVMIAFARSSFRPEGLSDAA
jgi:hypothetical protein